MKKISLYILTALFVAISACSPEKDLKLGDSLVQAEEIVGKWKLSKVEQFDAAPAGDHPESYDITHAFDFSQVVVEFKSDGGLSADFGTVPALFQTGDTYVFLGEDLEPDSEYPYFIEIVGGSMLTLNSMAFSAGELNVTVQGQCGSSASYQLTFEKL